ncbi:hypothetical protein Dfri01_46760 [Dyadobacter frigoris]|uniref:NmrA family NAD(P)-binding protein n=1 Tax=Dyadobacter frigoris TaxID=2576211 RepID=UPI0024A41F6E|nr:NmrA family NAD(P)-binding protein [Dyadobacter frigoris]GLU55215.1 hypothetical protein Dfri01_46760 [Dyadobacter frigoris]
MSKFVIAGGAGNVSKPLTEILLSKGHDVTVIGRSTKNLEEAVSLGAQTAIGDVSDSEFLSAAISGADAIYLMLPPNYKEANLKKLGTDFGKVFATAIEEAAVKNVVFLSSYGAHRLTDAGAISALGLAELELNKLEGVNVLHLRAGYFYNNLLMSLGQVKEHGVIGNMFEIPSGTFTIVDPQNIAEAVAEALITRNFTGHSYKYVVSDETGTDEIASLIGKEIGLPGLKWVRFSPVDSKNALKGFGFSDGAADEYVEMFAALDKGILFEDYFAGNNSASGTSIEEFAKTFATYYNLEN